jgi:hypothetical protein
VSSSKVLCRPAGLAVVVCLCILAFSACQYEVPITSSPTRKVQERLLGDWTSSDGKEKLKLRMLDDSIYIVYYHGDLSRAHHSDIDGTPFATVQDKRLSHRYCAFEEKRASS